MRFLMNIVGGVIFTLSTQIANAAILDFEGIDSYAEQLTTSGFDFKFDFSGWHVGRLPWYNYNGTNVLNGQGKGGNVEIKQSNDELFSVDSFDASVMLSEFSSGNLLVTGYYTDGSVINQSFNISNVYQTFQLNNFNNIASIRFSDSGLNSSGWRATSGMSLDNISSNTFSAVPDVPSALLLSLGLFSIALYRKYSSLNNNT